MNLGIWIRSVVIMTISLILKSVIACADINNSDYSVDVHNTKKGLKKAVTTLTMLSMVLCVVITPVQAEQSNIAELPVANFFAFSTSGDAPFEAPFFDTSKGTPTSWYWTFGDGTSSTKQDPTHTYSKPGRYTVTLKVTNAAGSYKVTKSNYITVKGSITDTGQKPVADFGAYIPSGNVPLNVIFFDNSKEKPTSWYWYFGDGATSTKQDPAHTYSESGSYTVTLTVTNDAGSDKETKYNYIIVDFTKNTPEKPVASFSSDVTSGDSLLKVKFTDESTETPTGWYWTFGDGDISKKKNPKHTYSEPGTYTVSLTSVNAAGSNTVIEYNYITVKEPIKNPVAKFSATPKSGIGPLTVEFTDKSTGSPTDCYWDFGDSSTSDSENPIHEYSQAGTYTVRLTATNDAGSDEETKYDYITVKEPAIDTELTTNTGQKPAADFDAYVLSGTAPFKVVFLDESKGKPTSWNWDFGDGTENSKKQDPEHIYSKPRSYTIKLTVTNDAGSDEKTKYDYITVTAPTKNTESLLYEAEKTVAKFSATPKSGNTPLTVEFTDESTETPTSWNWDFGDGTANSKKQDPEHIYSKPGSYTIKLTVTNDAGSDEKTKYDYITVTVPIKDTETLSYEAEKTVAKFSATPKSGNTPLTVEFTDESTETPTSWYWTFGDGATSTHQNPTHTYSKAGSYTVRLTATSDAGSDKVTKNGYIKVKASTKDTEISTGKSVSLSYLQLAATSDPARPQGETTPEATDSVKIVEAALVEEGLLNDKYAYDGSYGIATIKAYKKWQKSIGSAEKYCDGIPGEKDITKLGNKYGFTVDTSTVFESNVDINLNTPDYKQPTQTTTQEQPQIYRIDPNSGRAECVSHEDAQSQLHLSDQQFNSELRKGEVLILRNGRLSISAQETIGQINDPSRATPLMAFAIRKLQQDVTIGVFPSYYYETFSRAVIRESIRLNGADEGIEAVGKAFGSKDFSQGLAALHLYEALARRDENTGFDKVQHFTASAVLEFENTKIVTDIEQYGKEIFRDEIPSLFKDTDGYDPNDMLANNRGQAFGAELYRRYHPKSNLIGATKEWLKNKFERGLTRESSTMNTESKTNTEEKLVAKSETSGSKTVSLYYLQLAATSDPQRIQGGTTPDAVDPVKIVEAALVEAGFLADNSYARDGIYGTATIKAYKKWQKSIGSAERYCDGIPGEIELTKLGNKYGFTVGTSVITEKNKETSKSKSTYDRKAAVEYAHKYVEPLKGDDPNNKDAYNKDYYPFDSDCTNYVSQCLYVGGWKQIVKDDKRSSETWYFEKYEPGEHFWNRNIEIYSYTWTVADYFYKFCSTHPDRAKKVPIEKNSKGLLEVKVMLEVGDIIQMDGTGKNKPDGRWDHSMIITNISNGELYLSAHTTDREDISLSKIQKGNRNAKYVGWHII